MPSFCTKQQKCSVLSAHYKYDLAYYVYTSVQGPTENVQKHNPIEVLGLLSCLERNLKNAILQDGAASLCLYLNPVSLMLCILPCLKWEILS